MVSECNHKSCRVAILPDVLSDGLRSRLVAVDGAWKLSARGTVLAKAESGGDTIFDLVSGRELDGGSGVDFEVVDNEHEKALVAVGGPLRHSCKVWVRLRGVWGCEEDAGLGLETLGGGREGEICEKTSDQAVCREIAAVP